MTYGSRPAGLNEDGRNAWNMIENGTYRGYPLYYQIKSYPMNVINRLVTWIKDIPLTVVDLFSALYRRDSHSFDTLKRQTWNTFIAHPIELAATVVALPAIDGVAYKALCVKVDCEYYNTAEEQSKAQEARKAAIGPMLEEDGKVLNYNWKCNWDLVREELAVNKQVQQVKVEIASVDPFQSQPYPITIPREVALRLDLDNQDYFSRPAEILAASSSANKRWVRKNLIGKYEDAEAMVKILYGDAPLPERRDIRDRFYGYAENLQIPQLLKKFHT